MAQSGINPIYVLINSTNSNQKGEATYTNPIANAFTSNPKSREEHEVARVTKKIGTWTRLDRGKVTQQTTQVVFSGPCKWNFSTIDDHSDLPCSKKQALKNDAEISIQMVEVGAQPRQEQWLA